jgi:3-oxoacyl-[acyl-carrier-protein] synthase-3
MRCNDLHLNGVGAALGDLVPITALLRSESNLAAAVSGQRAISIADRVSGPQLAVRAAHQALATASTLIGSGALPVPDLHLHASIWRGGKGIDFWSAASYVRHQLGLGSGRGLAVEVNAMSNSMIGGLDLGASVLAGRPEFDTVLLTGGDAFGPPAFPHLSTDTDIAYGDGGSALLLGRRPGLARLVAIASYADPTLEGLHRGDTPFSPAGSVETGTINLRARKRAYLRLVDAETVHRRNSVGVTESAKTALADAGVPLDRIRWVLTPHYGHLLQESQCLRPLGLPPERTLRHVGDQWGHMGSNDQVAGLMHLLARRAVDPGDYVLLLGIGVGMTWTAAVVQIEQTPAELAAVAPPLLWPWHKTTATGRRPIASRFHPKNKEGATAP